MLLCFAVLADSADRSGMAASRFLATAAARGILLCFAAENRKSYCSGCIKVANGALAANFFRFGADDFPFTEGKISLK